MPRAEIKTLEDYSQQGEELVMTVTYLLNKAAITSAVKLWASRLHYIKSKHITVECPTSGHAYKYSFVDPEDTDIIYTHEVSPEELIAACRRYVEKRKRHRRDDALTCTLTETGARVSWDSLPKGR